MSPSFRSMIPAAALLIASTLASTGAQSATLSEGFEAMTPAGWTVQNNSASIGLASWFGGNINEFNAYAGTAASYAGVNYNSTAGASDISNWLIAPTLTFANGDVVSFFTRTSTDPLFADRLELRFSAVGGTNVGTTADSVGTFTTLLVSVNPTLASPSLYPSVWTQYSATISGLSGPTTGVVAFRYFVTDGGPSGANSNFVGIDSFSISPAAVPEPGTLALMALGLGGIVLRARARRA